MSEILILNRVEIEALQEIQLGIGPIYDYSIPNIQQIIINDILRLVSHDEFMSYGVDKNLLTIKLYNLSVLEFLQVYSEIDQYLGIYESQYLEKGLISPASALKVKHLCKDQCLN